MSPSVKYRDLLECLDSAEGTRDDREKKLIRLLNERIFDNKIHIPNGTYVKVCRELGRGYTCKRHREKLVRKIVDTIRKHESELRGSTETRAIHYSR